MIVLVTLVTLSFMFVFVVEPEEKHWLEDIHLLARGLPRGDSGADFL